ncbi:hypothetical protein A2410_03475 [Candidatus Shapirobacteria bacterium RIFOXYC1_FULL_38_24]|uniref:Transposase IS200-like domain-containing protein n=3 Tax=Candidatus Shapironibacteriota TaxID=1752721 RepID=A0A0G0JR51_9BACT|nr:MAG: hypothetical protein US90_C0018G0046 [Candidatus Shapirobacteria bacterium GW2011_GWE2_38_30]KKQ90272.1 MAG: hypothetical protein UT14_C0041G0005 [Candidatus Shapirobacteria bacterium GW2011_GWE1_38_92]OGL56233.1 MAG: hypothetical protein A2367_00820 [Candidatus Shapirobacteria bacterium RIFOXYB1_FULL_38_38]OGL56418.1 MAG: hypothetical protein A2410_03475 [Candidatus Shapirobacteria bacterium RIFOXYC1_FULL_38_24]
MPNHLHLMIGVGAHHDAPKKDRDNDYFRAIRESPLRSGNYEHIIRDEEEYIKIKEYIRMNPEKWCRDMNNPVNYK